MRAEHIAEFEGLYSAKGAWVEFFQNSKGYLETEFLVDEGHSHRYITMEVVAGL